MDTLSAFMIGEMNRGKDKMVFDWDKAVKLILENDWKNCGAGLSSDFEWTAGHILVDGKPYNNDYTYLASTWATPQLIVYGDKDDGVFEYEDVIDCYIMKSETEYDHDTKFPEHLTKLFDKV